MKVTKRQQNGIIIHFLLYLVLLIVVLYFSLTFLYPTMMSIEGKKTDTEKLHELIGNVTSTWITFPEFQFLSKDIEKSTYVKEILKDLKEGFYKENFINEDFLEFDDFLKNKETKLNSPKNKDILAKREKNIVNILPSYSENYVRSWEDSLTDFKFINYIESLLLTFNLSYHDSIWIKNLVLLDEFISQGWSQWSLKTNLFYIPVKLTVSWKKLEVINFLDYIQHVWNIEIKEKDIQIYGDNFKERGREDFKDRNGREIVLKWDKKTKDYNIYEHQIVDIESIKMVDYIDSSREPYQEEEKTGFIQYLKDTQGSEAITLDLRLRFYVKWYPNYKLESFIEKVLWAKKKKIIKNGKHLEAKREAKATEYKKYEHDAKTNTGVLMTYSKYELVKQEVNKHINDTKKGKTNNKKTYILLEIQNASTYLKEITKDITNIRKSLKKKEDLESLYKRAVEYDIIFESLRKLIKN
jgi:hypothetical protein